MKCDSLTGGEDFSESSVNELTRARVEKMDALKGLLKSSFLTAVCVLSAIGSAAAAYFDPLNAPILAVCGISMGVATGFGCTEVDRDFQNYKKASARVKGLEL